DGHLLRSRRRLIHAAARAPDDRRRELLGLSDVELARRGLYRRAHESRGSPSGPDGFRRRVPEKRGEVSVQEKGPASARPLFMSDVSPTRSYFFFAGAFSPPMSIFDTVMVSSFVSPVSATL